MRLRDVSGWPPTPGGSFVGAERIPTAGEGTFVACTFTQGVGLIAAHITLFINFKGRDCIGVIGDHPEPLLRRIQATIRGHEGQPLASLGILELIEIP